MSYHLCAGVAVGTTGISDKEELKLVVAFAMVLHKLPATFGLVSFLMASKWPRPRIRAALLAFAASAPLMALATYWLLVRFFLPCLLNPVVQLLAPTLTKLQSQGSFERRWLLLKIAATQMRLRAGRNPWLLQPYCSCALATCQRWNFPIRCLYARASACCPQRLTRTRAFPY